MRPWQQRRTIFCEVDPVRRRKPQLNRENCSRLVRPPLAAFREAARPLACPRLDQRGFLGSPSAASGAGGQRR